MIAALVKICLVAVLSLIFYQDQKERQVWFFLFPLFALLGTTLFYMNTNSTTYLYAILINLLIVGMLLLVLFILSRWVWNKKSLKEALGLGDILFFVGFAVSFPTVSFINFFAFSMIFALVIHRLLLKWKSLTHATVPLAGWMSLFLIMIYAAHWAGLYDELYLI
ncbi:hypothetical protein POV27_14280 [Aureisphaera galaxeae]|uniref:hypothetical protein n=1 Tax=Aureisphaera galaxeae TaxID=1538023 RepID=UPI00234FC91F|nr:hypothetical protein [Aureisphaera galaxeae]MDC8005225.1 hypothetical protein [Aureisphaera galaxeae]